MEKPYTPGAPLINIRQARNAGAARWKAAVRLSPDGMNTLNSGTVAASCERLLFRNQQCPRYFKWNFNISD
jgi:hypothetical protein